MSDTPRTDTESFYPHDSKWKVCDADCARQLERELNAANDYNQEIRERNEWLNDKIDAANDRIKRLEEALTSIGEYWNRDNNERAMENACWHSINTASEALKSKEAK